MMLNNYKNIVRRTMFFLSLILSTNLFSQHISKQPYLILPGENMMIVRVELDENRDCMLQYGLEEGKLINSVRGVIRGVKENHYLYEFRLEKLLEGKKYFYQVLLGDEKSRLQYFNTFKKNEKNIHFAAMGDSRSNPDIFDVVMDNVESNDPDFIISMGDLVHDGGMFSEWDTYYFDIAQNVIANIPLVSSLGDHEGNDDNGELFRHYLLTDEPLKKQWFSFDYGDAHFIALDYRRADSTEMINWFIDDVSKSKARWKFVYMHRPCYNFSGHQSRWGYDKWPELFRKYKIDIAFAGHSHIYERFYPMRPIDEPQSWPVTYITTGGAGAGLYKKTDNYTSLAFAESINHFVDVKISGDTLKLRTIDNKRSVIDSLTIIKKGDTHEEEYLNMVLDQHEVNLQASIISAISLTLDYVPIASNMTPGVDVEFVSAVDEDIPFDLELTKESAGFYKMKPLSGIIKAHEKEVIHLHIISIGENVCVHKWGEISPALMIKMNYKYGGKKEQIISVPAKYWY
jgi:hypothetical protein